MAHPDNELSSHDKTRRKPKRLLLSKRSRFERAACRTILTLGHSGRGKARERQRRGARRPGSVGAGSTELPCRAVRWVRVSTSSRSCAHCRTCDPGSEAGCALRTSGGDDAWRGRSVVTAVPGCPTLAEDGYDGRGRGEWGKGRAKTLLLVPDFSINLKRL